MRAKPLSQSLATELLQRFKHLIRVGGNGECWEYEGKLLKSGYAQIRFTIDGICHRFYAHRVVYTASCGEIPTGLELDHTCRNRRCVNPDHLEPVTTRVNLLRGGGVSANAFVKTHCQRGHPFDAENTLVRPGKGRWCRACIRLRARRSKGIPVALSDAERDQESLKVIDASTLAEAEARHANLVANAVDRSFGKRTHCPKGHEYTPENTRTEKNGHRHCRTCDRDHERKRRQRSKQQSKRNHTMKEAA
jgi:hypothetical protein